MAGMNPRPPGWIGPLLLAVIGAGACGSTEPGPGGPAGGLALVTTTAGTTPDHDGYTVMVDGQAHGTVGPNDSLALPEVDAGSHAVELSDIEFNCATLGQFTRTVAVQSGVEAVVNYSVVCDALSRSRIAVVKDRDFGNAELFVMNADGSGVTSLKDSLGAVHTRGMLLPSVSWSADGNRVAFTRVDGGLYATMDDGGVVRLATAGASPMWSEDGRKVAFLAAEPGAQLCCWDIFVAESDGSSVTQVTDGLSLLHYDFAANGSLLVYLDDPTTPTSLVVVRPDGTGRRQIVPPGACCPQLPSLSPDGSKVAYFAYPDAQGDNGPGYEIYVSPTDGSGPTVDVSNNPGDDWWPVWSPDGTRIAFVSSRLGGFFGPGSLHAVNADGTDQITLTPADNAWEPAWSPDGTRIAYSGGSHLFVANADGSGRSEINPDWDSSRPTWSGR